MSKAWRVGDRYGEKATIVHTTTRGLARAVGAQVLDLDFIEVEVNREKWADELAFRGVEIDWDDKGTAEIMREHGWWRGREDRCVKCGLSEWENLPLSQLSNGQCRYCKGEIYED